MGITSRIALWMFFLLILITEIGKCSYQQDKARLEHEIRVLQNSGPIPDLGVVPQKVPTKFIKFNSNKDECLSKKEFYEGMEDAEMKGMDDDPSAQDIYDEFNR